MDLPTFAKNRGQILGKTNMSEGEDGIRDNSEVKPKGKLVLWGDD